MDNLQGAEKLRCISDNSEWKFLHYESIQGPFGSTSEDKNFIHVREWGTEDQSGDGHKKFPTTDFEIA